MIDVHAHINLENFPLETNNAEKKKAFHDILSAAKSANISRIVSVSENIYDVQHIFDLAAQSDGLIKPAVGLHPVQRLDVNDTRERSVTLSDLEHFEPVLKEAIANKKICCVGEIGLDYSRHIVTTNQYNDGLSEDESRNEQRQVFRRQVELAMAADLPVNVHSRSAGHHALEILYECRATRVVMHAFDGRPAHAKKAVEAGYYFSVPPSIVRSPHFQKVVAALPLSSLLLESDSPALGPEKGVDNEPANITLAAQEIARIKDIQVEEVVKQTTANARTLFGPAI
ncbi:hypothetical protein BDB00DRAFT_815112 [Zychaea mexicana]|uniref:uncharacterized protein n=1 Tax=Zychaea mexicana TaxID=64656 RepID=UPI0022FF4589|nr:uncharacterized protein BDB00DRAFT_815112 [Zychaea mexicana]KAI9495212.1 hypothetical protein BDB00DRAFT_815112 [Zychaea mexicana]